MARGTYAPIVSPIRRLGVAWLLLLVACGRGTPAAGDSLATRAVAAARGQGAVAIPPSAAPRDGEAAGRRPGFRSRRLLEEHFAKHGAEFGDITIAEYLGRARALRDAPVGGDILEIRRDDGTTSRFDRATGSFLAFNPDGTIRTFFRPNDGEAYFRRQARRRPGR